MRAHGAAAGCYKQGIRPACAECREYQIQRKRSQGETPGTYRYEAMRGNGPPRWNQQDRDRNWRRESRSARDLQRLADLRGGLNGQDS